MAPVHLQQMGQKAHVAIKGGEAFAPHDMLHFGHQVTRHAPAQHLPVARGQTRIRGFALGHQEVELEPFVLIADLPVQEKPG